MFAELTAAALDLVLPIACTACVAPGSVLCAQCSTALSGPARRTPRPHTSAGWSERCCSGTRRMVARVWLGRWGMRWPGRCWPRCPACLLYTSDAADEEERVA